MIMDVMLKMLVETEDQKEPLKSALERLAQNIETQADELLIMREVAIGIPNFPNFKVGNEAEEER